MKRRAVSRSMTISSGRSQPLVMSCLLQALPGGLAAGAKVGSASRCRRRIETEAIVAGKARHLRDDRAVLLLGGAPRDVAEVEVVLDGLDFAGQRVAEAAPAGGFEIHAFTLVEELLFLLAA